MKINIKEPYKTALIIGLATSTFLGVAYVLMPSKYRDAMNAKFKKMFNKNTQP
jgi:hypothetical protein